MKKKYFIIILIALIFCLFQFTPLKKNIAYQFAKQKIEKINKDSLDKYFTVFKMRHLFDDYKKEGFLNYLEPLNSKLHNQLSNSDIKLYSPKEQKYANSLEGVYYDIISKKLMEGALPNQLLIYQFNIKKFKENILYTIDNNEVKPIIYINTTKMIAKTIPCDEGAINIPINADSLSFSNFQHIFFKEKNNPIRYSKDIDKRMIDIINEDSLIMEVSKKYSYIFSLFNYEPIDSFYCD